MHKQKDCGSLDYLERSFERENLWSQRMLLELNVFTLHGFYRGKIQKEL